DARSRRAVVAAELVACDLLPEAPRISIMRAAEQVFQNWESGEARYAAEAAMAAVSRPGKDQVDSWLTGQGFFFYVTQHMRWIGSRCGSWSVVNTYEGCLRGLLLKEPHPPELYPSLVSKLVPPSKYRFYDGK